VQKNLLPKPVKVTVKLANETFATVRPARSSGFSARKNLATMAWPVLVSLCVFANVCAQATDEGMKRKLPDIDPISSPSGKPASYSYTFEYARREIIAKDSRAKNAGSDRTSEPSGNWFSRMFKRHVSKNKEFSLIAQSESKKSQGLFSTTSVGFNDFVDESAIQTRPQNGTRLEAPGVFFVQSRIRF
jgi:hypothetical protein